MLGRSILAKNDTWLKTRPSQSTDLLPEENFQRRSVGMDQITMFANAAHYEVRLTAQPAKVGISTALTGKSLTIYLRELLLVKRIVKLN